MCERVSACVCAGKEAAMSAVVCGSKRSNLFEEAGVHPPIAKRSRCGSNSNSPVRLSLCRGESSPSPSPCSVGFTDSPKSSSQSLIAQLKALFPHMDDQVHVKGLPVLFFTKNFLLYVCLETDLYSYYMIYCHGD